MISTLSAGTSCTEWSSCWPFSDMTMIFDEVSMMRCITSRWVGRWFGEHRVKRRDDWHLELRQKLGDIAAGLAAKNPVFMLKANNIVAGVVQELSRIKVVVDIFGWNFKAYGLRIVIGATWVCHRYDAGLKIGTGHRNRPMKVMGKGRDAAEARKMIADERYSLNRFH